MWLVLALVAAFFTASRDPIYKKLLTADINLYVLGGMQFIIAGILLGIVVVITGIPPVESGFVVAVCGTVILNIFAVWLHFRAIKLGDISIVSPLLSLTPVFAIGTSFIMLGEMPTALGICGIFLVVLGSYVLQWHSQGESPIKILRRMRQNKATLYIIAVAALFSISANFDRAAATAATPLFGSMVIDLTLGAALIALSPLEKRESIKRSLSFSTVPWLAALGLLFAIGTWAQNTALTLEIVPYVNAATRSSAIVSVLYGAYILREGHVKWRFLGAIIMLIGISLFAF